MTRFTALDALRGLAILGMCLSGRIPWDGLPAWMYHAQSPPPTHEVSPTAFGITWVDLVFPFFLFAMGAAIPLSLRQRLDREPVWKVVAGVIFRGLLLGLFAVIVQHIRPDQIAKDPNLATHWTAIGLFFAVALAFAKWPKSFPTYLGMGLRLLGWAILVATFAYLPFRDERGFDPASRADIILMVLAHVSVTTSLIWIFTQKGQLARFGWIGVVMALFLASSTPGWVSQVWHWTPADWAYQLEFQKYLLITLPGTFVGDLYLRHHEGGNHARWSGPRLAAICIIGIVILTIATIGLQKRTLEETAVACLSLSVIIAALTVRPQSAREFMLHGIVMWGSFLLSIGLISEGIGGGIRKDSPTTLSYFFVCAGLAAFLLTSLAILFDAWRKWNPLKFVADAGANPMIGYIAITNLSSSIFVVTRLEDWVAEQSWGPWHLAAYAALKTLFVGLVAATATSFKFFLRA